MRVTRIAALVMLSVGLACTTTTSNLSTVAAPRELPGYAKSFDQVFSASVDAVSLLTWEITVAQKDAGLISAKTPLNISTVGDKVTIRIFKGDVASGDSLTHVGFSSGSNQAFDWGRNSRFYDQLTIALGAPANVRAPRPQSPP